MDMVQSMMSFIDLPDFFWGHTLLSAIHLLNRVPSKSVPTTPYELWHGEKPTLRYLKIWRCPAYVKQQQADKLETRSFRARDRKSTRLNSSHSGESRMPSSA